VLKLIVFMVDGVKHKIIYNQSWVGFGGDRCAMV
jgi:hypothetical protein